MLDLPIWQQVVEQVFRTEEIVARDLKKYVDGRYFEMKYESLCNDPATTVKELYDWLGAAGYEHYENFRLPEKFSVSNKVTLEPNVVANMRAYLSKLETNGIN